MPGIKSHAQQRMAKGGDELENSIASRELAGYLSTKMPSYAELKAKIDKVDNDGYHYCQNAGTDAQECKERVSKYLEVREKHYETFAEFIGVLDTDYKNQQWSKDETGLDFTDSNAIFEGVTWALFLVPACRYPGSDGSKCSTDPSAKPVLYYPKIEAGHFSTNDISPDAVTAVDVTQPIPLPDGSKLTISLKKSSDDVG
jgi:hypothetical protein